MAQENDLEATMEKGAQNGEKAGMGEGEEIGMERGMGAGMENRKEANLGEGKERICWGKESSDLENRKRLVFSAIDWFNMAITIKVWHFVLNCQLSNAESTLSAHSHPQNGQF